MQQHTSTSTMPGNPVEIWTSTLTSPLPHLDRPRDVPRPESVEEVARWEDPDGFGKIELVYAPAFWVFLPVSLLSQLIWGTITDPGDGWTGNLFDDDAARNLWSFWVVWAGVGVWLLIATGALLFRLGLIKDVRAQNQWIFEHGVPHTIHRSPFTRDGGEEFTSPTFIAIGHRIDDEQAAKIHHALRTWLSDGPCRSS